MVLQYVDVFSTGNTYIDKLILENGVDTYEEPTIYLNEDRKILLLRDHCVLTASFIYRTMVISYEWDEEETEFCVNIFNKDLFYKTIYGNILLYLNNIKTVSIIDYGEEKRKIDFMCKHNIRYCDFYHKSKRVLEYIMSRQPEITDIPDLYNQAISVTSCTKNARKQ